MKIKIIALIVITILLQSCYTQVEIPQNTVPIYKSLRKIEFYLKVVDTFDNNFPDYGYYYEFQPSITRSDVINRKIFLEKLYSEGYNIVAAWYCPSRSNCSGLIGDVWPGNTHLSPVFILLLSDVDDSIINYNFYGLTEKPFIECPNDVEIYMTQLRKIK